MLSEVKPDTKQYFKFLLIRGTRTVKLTKGKSAIAVPSTWREKSIGSCYLMYTEFQTGNMKNVNYLMPLISNFKNG